MYDFKPGDKVQIDPALVNSGFRKHRGVGTVVNTREGGTEARIIWPGEGGLYTFSQTRDLIPVMQIREAKE